MRLLVFTAHLVPSNGGETGWVDMRAAYNELSPSMKEKLSGLSAYHSYEWSQKERFGHKDPKVSEFNSYGFDIDPKPNKIIPKNKIKFNLAISLKLNDSLKLSINIAKSTTKFI